MVTKILHETVRDEFALYHGDNVDVMRALPDASVHLTVTSIPFALLYTYSNSPRDMGNVRSHAEFFEHLGFLLPEWMRVTMPGRLCAVHVMILPTVKERDGHIGLRDFRGETIRAFEGAGWIYHSEVCIWKDPVTAMQRTKALGLLHKQIKKDSAMSRQGIADYVVVFRRPGTNPEPVTHTNESFSVDRWQKWASPVWTDVNPTRTLQYQSAREHDDERHICPLQLDVVERCIGLWSNPGDVILDPFAGIGTTGHVALHEGRRFVGAELKASYYQQAVRNLEAASSAGRKQRSLFDREAG